MAEILYQTSFQFSDLHAIKTGVKDEQADLEIPLRQLLKQDLTFKGMKTNYATHSLHAFAAKFPPQLPRLFINELTKPGEIVFDPMSGSGTTIVEAVLAGRKAIGTDLDPLAVLIGNVKSTPLNVIECHKLGTEVLEKARSLIRDIETEQNRSPYSAEVIEFFNYWFESQTIKELDALIRAIKKIENVKVRMFLEVVFSSIIITKSGSLTLARDLAHSRPHRDLKKEIKQSAFNVFYERLFAAIEALRTISDAPGQGLVIRSDARFLPLADSSIDLIITSPPYAANAIDYMRAHKFSLMWLGYSSQNLTALRKKYIGAELKSKKLEFASETANGIIENLLKIDKNRASVVAHYFSDLEAGLKEMLRVLAKGKPAIIVVGSSNIRGVEIKVPTVIAEIGASTGFKVVDVATREIVRNARMLPTSHNSSRNGIEARMHEEGVVALLKP